MVESVLGRRVGVYCNFIIHFLFLLFLVFHGAGGVGGEFAISQLIWGILVSGSSILVVSPGGISTRCIGRRGGVDYFLTNRIICDTRYLSYTKVWSQIIGEAIPLRKLYFTSKRVTYTIIIFV